MLPEPCYIISDAHLGVGTARAEAELLGFLDHARRTAGSLAINGDLFDFWFEWKTVIPRLAFRVLASLRSITEAGIHVLWVAGNHDCWGGDMLRDEVGVAYQLDPWEGDIAGWQTRLEHGDGIRGREDRRYRMIRPVMRNRLAIAAFRALHPDFATRVATASSGASRTHGTTDEGDALRAIGFATLGARPDIDLLVYGHSHVPTLERGPHGVFANAGAWLERPTFLAITGQRISLREWDGSAEGMQLDAIDRSAEKPSADIQKSLW